MESELAMISYPRNVLVDDAQDCEECGAYESVSCTIRHQRFIYGSGADKAALDVEVPVWSCRECGFGFTAHRAEAIRHDAVCRHLDRPTPDDIRALRRRFGMSQEDLARATRLGPASIKRWESGNQIPSASVAIALRLLELPGNMEFLCDLASEGKSGVGRHLPSPTFRTPMSQKSFKDAERFVLRPGRPEAPLEAAASCWG